MSRNKRVKEETDEELGGHSPQTGTAGSKAPNKRRRTNPARAHDTAISSSPLPFVASDAKARTSPARRQSARQNGGRAARREHLAEADLSLPDTKPRTRVKAESPEPLDVAEITQAVANPSTSTFQAGRDNTESQAALAGQPTASSSQLGTLQSSQTSLTTSSGVAPEIPPKSAVDQEKRRNKGKGRATSPRILAAQADALKTKRFQEEIIRLKAELENARGAQVIVDTIAEHLTCNICLETLRQPLALTCGHVFCQNDLWNWFHRRRDDEDSSDSEEGSLSSSSEEETDSEEDGLLVNSARPNEIDRRLATRDQTRRNDRDQDDLVVVADDFDTDDSFDDSDTSDAANAHSTDLVVQGRPHGRADPQGHHAEAYAMVRMQPTRGAQASRHADTNDRAMPENPELGVSNNQTEQALPYASRQSDSESVHGDDIQPDQRIPALPRPRKKNLCCPQCRRMISIPPFPIFALRSVSDALGTRTSASRAQTADTRREATVVSDPTWGGLFPRAAGGMQTATVGSVARDVLGGQDGIAHDRQANPDRLYSEPVLQPGQNFSARARSGVVQLENLFEDDLPPQAGPSRADTGQRRRNSHDRAQERQLADLLRSRNARRRAAAQARRHHDTHAQNAVWNAHEQESREIEDRAIEIIQRELLQSRMRRTAENVRVSRGRDVFRHGIKDADDGVRRCIDCNWEIEDNTCQHCGALYDSDSEFGGRGDDLSGEMSSHLGSPGHTESSFVEHDTADDASEQSYGPDSEIANVRSEPEEDHPSDGSNVDGEDGTIAGSEGSSLGESDDEPVVATSRSRAVVPPSRRRRIRRHEPSKTRSADDDVCENSDHASDEYTQAKSRDLLADDEDEGALHSRRDTRNALQEERHQARAAARLVKSGQSGSSSETFTDQTSSDSSSDSDGGDEDGSGPTSFSSACGMKRESPSEPGSEEDIPTISSQAVKRDLHAIAGTSERRSIARENAARAAISRNTCRDIETGNRHIRAMFEESVRRCKATDRTDGPAQVVSARPPKPRRIIETPSDDE